MPKKDLILKNTFLEQFALNQHDLFLRTNNKLDKEKNPYRCKVSKTRLIYQCKGKSKKVHSIVVNFQTNTIIVDNHLLCRTEYHNLKDIFLQISKDIKENKVTIREG